MLKRVLNKAVCIVVCMASLAVGTGSNLQTVSGQTDGAAVSVSYGYAKGQTDLRFENIATIKKSSGKSDGDTAGGWSEDKQYYFYEDGKKATGIVLIKGKFYCFKSNGKYNKSKTKKIQKVATYEKPLSKLLKYIGKPKKSKYYASCYGKGKDGILTYDNFKVYTFRPDSGSEIFMGAE